MKQTVQRDAAHNSRTDDPKRSRPAQQQTAAPGGRLAQLAAMMNGSPRAQRLAQLKDDIQRSPRVQYLADLAAEINQGAPVQRAGTPVNDDAGLEHEANVMGAKAATQMNGSSLVQMQRRVEEERESASRQKQDSTIRAASGVAVIQAKWEEGAGPFLKWTPAIEGYTWWFDQKDGTMAYTPKSVKELGLDQAHKLTWRPHKEWQIKALESIDPDAQKPITLTFEEMVKKGKKRWLELQKAMESEGGKLDPGTQAARDWFFKEYYTTTTSGKGGGKFDVASNYNARPKSYNTKRAKGEYTGTFSPEEGNMRLDQTFALGGPGEVYYNPSTGNAERMPASEVLFQQWRMAAKSKSVPKLKVKEESVAGDGWVMLKDIRKETGVTGKDATFKPEQDGFWAMLAVPNVTAAIYLIRDHGIELGIHTITGIVVQKSGHILIHFG